MDPDACLREFRDIVQLADATERERAAREPEPVRYCECGHAAHAHPYQSGPGMTWCDPCLAAGCGCSRYREVRP